MTYGAGVGCRVYFVGCGVQSSRFRAKGVGFSVQRSRFRV